LREHKFTYLLTYLLRDPAPEVLKHSTVQGQFKALLPVDHSIAYSPAGTQEKRHHFEAFMHDIY